MGGGEVKTSSGRGRQEVCGRMLTGSKKPSGMTFLRRTAARKRGGEKRIDFAGAEGEREGISPDCSKPEAKRGVGPMRWGTSRNMTERTKREL